MNYSLLGRIFFFCAFDLEQRFVGAYPEKKQLLNPTEVIYLSWTVQNPWMESTANVHHHHGKLQEALLWFPLTLSLFR